VICGLSRKWTEWKLVAPVNISSAFNPSTQPFHGRKQEERKKRRGKVKRNEKGWKERRCEGKMGGKQGENKELTGNGR